MPKIEPDDLAELLELDPDTVAFAMLADEGAHVKLQAEQARRGDDLVESIAVMILAVADQGDAHPAEIGKAATEFAIESMDEPRMSYRDGDLDG